MASYRDRITQSDGQGIRVTKGTPPPEGAKKHLHFLGTDHVITEEEALEMGRALFDAIASDQAKAARKKG